MDTSRRVPAEPDVDFLLFRGGKPTARAAEKEEGTVPVLDVRNSQVVCSLLKGNAPNREKERVPEVGSEVVEKRFSPRILPVHILLGKRTCLPQRKEATLQWKIAPRTWDRLFGAKGMLSFACFITSCLVVSCRDVL